MPIVQLQSEFAAALSIAPPEYTWATKPSAAGNAGKRITIIGWMAPPSDWVSDGTYWLPVGGRAVVHAPMLTDAQVTGASTLTLVSSVPGWQLPTDMSLTPGLMIESWVHGALASQSAAQQRQIYVGTPASQNAVAGLTVTGSAGGPRVWGEVSRRADGNWQSYAPNLDAIVGGTSMSSTSAAAMLSGPISVWYQGGNTDGTEIMTVGNFSIAVRVG